MSAARTGSSKPSIVLTYPYPIGEKSNGGSRTLRETALHLAKAGADVTVVSVSTNALKRAFPRKPMDPQYLGAEHDATFAAHGVELLRVPQDPWLHLWDGRSVRRAVKELLRRRRVDLVLGHYHEAGFLPPLCRAAGVRFGFFAIWQSYQQLVMQPKNWRARMQKRIRDRLVVDAHRAADITFASSAATKKELVDLLGVDAAKVVVCPLGLERRFLSVPRAKPERITNLLFFGRVTWLKGFDDALEAMRRLREKGVNGWHLRFIGERPPGLLERIAREKGVADYISADGPFDDAGLREEMARAHVAILPSHAEAFGHSIVEAQAAGLPVVSYAIGSVPEVVADGESGWLAPFRDVGRLSDLIGAAIADPERTYRTGLAARERAARLYSWERTAQTVLDHLR